jgi:hypothetical protein
MLSGPPWVAPSYTRNLARRWTGRNDLAGNVEAAGGRRELQGRGGLADPVAPPRRGQRAEARRLLDELLGYPDVPGPWRSPKLDASTAPFLPIELAARPAAPALLHDADDLGTPHDIALQELRIESFFPADQDTEDASRALGVGG